MLYFLVQILQQDDVVFFDVAVDGLGRLVLLLWDGSCLTSPALRATSPMKGGLGAPTIGGLRPANSGLRPADRPLGGPYDWHFGQ